MARFALPLAVLVLCPLTSPAQLPPPPKDPLPPPAVKPGDPAPPLKGAGWYGTAKVPEFENGKAYVVVFWHVDDPGGQSNVIRLSNLCGGLKGVTPVAVSRAPTDKFKLALEPYAAFLDDYHAPIKLAFVNDPTAGTARAYQGENNDPNSFVFVVGKDGKVAYVATDPGTIENLTEVLPKVLDGKWNVKTDGEKLAEADAAYAAIHTAFRKQLGDALKPDPKRTPAEEREVLAKVAGEALKACDEFAKAHPLRAERDIFRLDKLSFALWAGQKEAAVKTAAVIADSAKPRQSARALTLAAMRVCDLYHSGSDEATCKNIMLKLAAAANTVEGKSAGLQDEVFELGKYVGRVQGRTTSIQMMKKHMERYPGQKEIKEEIIAALEAEDAAWQEQLKKAKEKEKEKPKGREK